MLFVIFYLIAGVIWTSYAHYCMTIKHPETLNNTACWNIVLSYFVLTLIWPVNFGYVLICFIADIIRTKH